MLSILGLGLLINSALSQPQAVLGAYSNVLQPALLSETNLQRQDNTKPGLTTNTQLQQAAQAKALDMVKRDYWSHDTPDGQQPWYFINEAGYKYQLAGENLAYGFASANSVIKAWMNSPEHRDNLLSTSYSQVGFGIAQSPNFQGNGPETIVVAMYGLPAGSGQALEVQGNVQTPESAVRVDRLQTVASTTLSGFIVGIIGTLAVLAVLFRHAIAWRKLLKRGEKFVLKHPVLDFALVTVAVSAGILIQTAGVIR